MTARAFHSEITAIGGPPAAIDADLIVLPWFEEEGAAAVPGIDEASAGEVGRALASKEFSARPYDVFTSPVSNPSWRARRVALIGAGRRDGFGSDLARRVATAAGLWAKQHRVRRAAFAMRPDEGGPDQREMAQAVAEGLTLAEFDAGRYKTREHEELVATRWTVVVGGKSEVPAHTADAVNRGRLLGECSNLARELANEPGNALTPREFAARASAIASAAGVHVEVLDEEQIARLQMGLLLGVARGSSEPPRLIVFRYEPPGAPVSPVLGLVGKGITFDTGGISIKPAEGDRKSVV